MDTFWNNISKFPKFIISVFIGFFLTTVYPIFKLLKNKKTNYGIIIFLFLISSMLYLILKLMLGYAYI
ncbi:DUF751 domain-containing protein [uncultured Thermosynechococcus sp.]|uniref:DUF751 domain-containing protein n=1 Tax=uncultured Thermosynechococcus sp. TaxID=436945 RepID=UPI00345946D5